MINISWTKASIFLLLICASLTLSAQDQFRPSEKRLDSLFTLLNTGGLNGWVGDEVERAELIDSMIEAEFMSILIQPGSMTYSFDSLKTYVDFALASDKKLRFISWNTRLGGTMQNVEVLAQYIGKDGKLHVQNAKDGEEMGYDQAVSFSRLYCLGNDRYLAFGFGKYSTREMAYSIFNYKIENDKLTDTSAIFLLDSTLERSLYNGYDYFKPFAGKSYPRYIERKHEIKYTAVSYDDIKGKNVREGNICLFYDGSIFRRKGKTK